MHRSFQKLFPLSVLLLGLLFTSCSSSSTLQHPTTSATLWAQNAAEYKALTTSVYNTALSNLGMAIEDSYWTAYPKQEDQKMRKLPAAVILDVDETVLDNSPFQARMIKQKSSFDPEQWNDWVMEAKANPIAGAVEFTQRAADHGVAVFYLTNRETKVEEGTRQNLKKLGFPLSENQDRILSNNERDNWTSAKTERRAYVAKNYRIIMIFGDDLNDFVPAKGISQQERSELVENNSSKWGKFWYVLPNPSYGSWENALYNFDDSLSPTQIDSARKARLNTKKN
ncbi:5'-nucleotidase, lipoprotein e(P4) family [Aliifodinibius salipaludis]|uniref:5'-nucleotidase, lipoprotein e(P4) family n=1 Tax=Fodinibius salipaludis TaxID=2032627 RepID=A0A2A2GES3_9BACT|nr:5'-nucleotidase, lipoprotein e(P4) family [Aliifodinibius salipaludis]PAU95494.1 5'-nucleotidase, lipoprotein e(P4) family [Aliifodinibius salipaludis]